MPTKSSAVMSGSTNGSPRSARAFVVCRRVEGDLADDPALLLLRGQREGTIPIVGWRVQLKFTDALDVDVVEQRQCSRFIADAPALDRRQRFVPVARPIMRQHFDHQVAEIL